MTRYRRIEIAVTWLLMCLIFAIGINAFVKLVASQQRLKQLQQEQRQEAGR